MSNDLQWTPADEAALAELHARKQAVLSARLEALCKVLRQGMPHIREALMSKINEWDRA